MADWAQKLDGFLKLNEREILTDAGRISHELALERAAHEFEKYDAERRRLEDAARSHATIPGVKRPRSPFREGRPTISTRTPSCRTNRRISPTTSSDSRETTVAPRVMASWMISVNFRCSIAERFSGRSRRRRT
ncbi:MAG TPA: RhuM family protein [Thermoanaerobaculia bacterium]